MLLLKHEYKVITSHQYKCAFIPVLFGFSTNLKNQPNNINMQNVFYCVSCRLRQ